MKDHGSGDQSENKETEADEKGKDDAEKTGDKKGKKRATKKDETEDKSKSKQRATKASKKNTQATATEEGEGENPASPNLVPKAEKDQVACIVKYLKGINYLGERVAKHNDLDDDIKADFRKDTPNSEEGRLGVYWKTPSVGVYIRSEKREFCNLPMKYPELPYHLCLGAALKAASMLAP